MLFRLLTQLVLASSFLQIFPADAGVIEQYAREAQARPVSGVYEAVDLLQRSFPVAKDATRLPTKVDLNSLGVVTSAVSALVLDRLSGQVLFEKNSSVSRSIGSITKLMTALLFLENNPNLEEAVPLLSEDVRAGGVQHFAVDDFYKVRDLLHASLVSSDNTATAALARLSRLSEGDFVARMNERASELGMRETTFVDPAGLSQDNRAVAADIVLLLDATMQNDFIRTATEIDSVTVMGQSGRSYFLENTNELLGTFVDQPPYKIVGGKTGYLPAAGYCLGLVLSENNDHEIIVVVLGSETKDGRLDDVKALGLWTYKVYAWPNEL
jgi:D-alanyl-D-alanine endopeptidase (penicillin-binding protein 7)